MLIPHTPKSTKMVVTPTAMRITRRMTTQRVRSLSPCSFSAWSAKRLTIDLPTRMSSQYTTAAPTRTTPVRIRF